MEYRRAWGWTVGVVAGAAFARIATADPCATTCASTGTDIFCKCAADRIVQSYETESGPETHTNELIWEIEFETFYAMKTRVHYWNDEGTINRYTDCETTDTKTHSFRIWHLRPGSQSDNNVYHWKAISCSTFTTASGVSVTTSTTGPQRTFSIAPLPSEKEDIYIAYSRGTCSAGNYSGCEVHKLADGTPFFHVLVETRGDWSVARRAEGEVVWYAPFGVASWNDVSQTLVVGAIYTGYVQEMNLDGSIAFEANATNACIQHEVLKRDDTYVFLSGVGHGEGGDRWINQVATIADNGGGGVTESVLTDLHDFYAELHGRAVTARTNCQFQSCNCGQQCADWDHSNSVDFYEGSYLSGGVSYEGGILVSSRNLDQVSFFSADGSTLLWTLGLQGDFDLYDSDGVTLLAARTTNNGDTGDTDGNGYTDEQEWFHDQHFARFIDDEAGQLQVLIYDNNSEDDCPAQASCTDIYDPNDGVGSRVFVLELDPASGTATIVRRLHITDVHDDGTFSDWYRCVAGGAATLLAHDHVLVSCQVGSASSKLIEYDDRDDVVWSLEVPGKAYRGTPIAFPEP